MRLADRQGIAILGATGSIGASTLDVMARHPERYRLVAASANDNVDGMRAVCRAHQPEWVVMRDADAAQRLEDALRADGLPSAVSAGAEALVAMATHPAVDQVMAAIVGGAGLAPTLAAAEAGKRVLLANKEALVMAGDRFMRAVRESGAELLPIDSEHNAIFQCMPAGFRCGDTLGADAGVAQIILTASGGPFLNRAAGTVADATPAEAVAHPNWSMGRKISVDSATMMNKGLELIEAAWLFGLPAERLGVLMHPQSVVHSMVRMADGSVLAQLGAPDMRTPIAYSMAWPARIDSGVPPLDFAAMAQLAFAEACREQFPGLGLAEQALRQGGDAAIVLNAANEVAVDAFLKEDLRFGDIHQVVGEALRSASGTVPDSLEAILECDARARAHAATLIQESFAPAGGRSQHA